MEQDNFPREVTEQEKKLLFSVLPDYKPGYNAYREKINNLVITGYGRFGASNLVLGKPGTQPDHSYPSTPVFALGTIKFEDNRADIIIHEEIDDEIEIDISFEKDDTGELNEIGGWNYSEWNPGDNAPDDGSEVREINITQAKFILVIAPAHKKIWIHEIENGINLLIPVTNFYNYLMIIRNIRSAGKVFKPALLFTELGNYTDADLRNTFIAYNKYFKRIKAEFAPAKPAPESAKKLLGFFKRG